MIGLVNVILFTTTRRVLPQHSVISHRFSRASKAKSSSSTAGSKTLIDEEVDLEKSKEIDDKFNQTYIDHDDENWAGRGTSMFKTVESPDDDGRSDYSYPSRSNSMPVTDTAPISVPLPMPTPQHQPQHHARQPLSPSPLQHQQHYHEHEEYPHPPGIPRHSPGEDHFEHVSLDSSSAVSSPRFTHHHGGGQVISDSETEPDSPLVATDYILRTPSTADSR